MANGNIFILASPFNALFSGSKKYGEYWEDYFQKRL